MAFSPFDKRLLEEGLAFFDQPRLTGLMEMLGSTEVERTEALATMLRNSSPDEFDEAVAIFERAVTRVAPLQARARDEERDETSNGESRRRSYSASAERRKRRRRSS
jgi:flagellar motor switch protein FliG